MFNECVFTPCHTRSMIPGVRAHLRLLPRSPSLCKPQAAQAALPVPHTLLCTTSVATTATLTPAIREETTCAASVTQLSSARPASHLELLRRCKRAQLMLSPGAMCGCISPGNFFKCGIVQEQQRWWTPS